jgi:hypothetical protein
MKLNIPSQSKPKSTLSKPVRNHCATLLVSAPKAVVMARRRLSSPRTSVTLLWFSLSTTEDQVYSTTTSRNTSTQPSQKSRPSLTSH